MGPLESDDAQLERGAMTDFIEVSIVAKGAGEIWRSLAEELKFNIEESGVPGSWSASFVALPSPFVPLCPYVEGSLHLHTQDTSEAHWTFWVRRSGEEAPPPYLTARSERVGGWPMVARQLTESWPAERGIRAVCEGTYYVFPNEWDFRSKTSLPPRRKVGRVTLRPKSASWILSGGTALTSLTYSKPVRGLFMLETKARLQFQFDANFLQTVDQTIWDDLKKLLLRKRSSR